MCLGHPPMVALPWPWLTFSQSLFSPLPPGTGAGGCRPGRRWFLVEATPVSLHWHLLPECHSGRQAEAVGYVTVVAYIRRSQVLVGTQGRCSPQQGRARLLHPHCPGSTLALWSLARGSLSHESWPGSLLSQVSEALSSHSLSFPFWKTEEG